MRETFCSNGNTVHSAANYEAVLTYAVGENKGSPRVWIENHNLDTCNFLPGTRLVTEFRDRAVVLRVAKPGEAPDRVVSSKKLRSGVRPVIDLNTKRLLESLGPIARVEVRLSVGEIVIVPERVAEKVATRCRNGKEGAVFAGGGFLSEAAKLAGFESAWGIEIDHEYAETYKRNNPGAVVFAQSVSEVRTELLTPVERLTIGIPCPPFSRARTLERGRQNVKRDRSLPPEAHELGDLTYWALKIIDALNPASVLVEQVAGYLNSGACHILLGALKRMGYEVEAQVLDPTEYGSIQMRKRAVILATTGEKPKLPRKSTCQTTLGDLLEKSEGPDIRWWTREDPTGEWVMNHWDRQSAAGNGFTNNLVMTESTSRVPTIKKGYFKGIGDQPVVAHPSQPGTYRWLTIREVARLNEVPEYFILPETKTRAGEMLGNGVLVRFFEQVNRAMEGGPDSATAPLVADAGADDGADGKAAWMVGANAHASDGDATSEDEAELVPALPQLSLF